MRVPLFTPIDDPTAKKMLKRTFLDLNCFGPCQRRIKACLSVLFCLALLFICLYLDIVAILFWDSLLRHSPDRALPLRSLKRQENWETTKNPLINETVKLEARKRQLSDVLNTSLNYWLSDLPVIDNWCGRMSNGLLSDEEADRLANWNVNQSTERYLPGIKKQNPAEMPEAGCKNLKRLFPFPEEPATEEELQFPLAYGILVHKSPLQVFLLMSVIYQPQNAYCLAVDDRADEQFKKQMNLLMDCFSNIFVMTVNKVEWCEFGVVRGVFNCLRYLSELDHKWRYYQYLSGVDLPLKTNLEMVRIFKKLNGTLNAEILPFETSRIKGSQVFMQSPLTLWKSSLSALMSRESVNAIISSKKVRQQLNYLKFGYCSDEVKFYKLY